MQTIETIELILGDKEIQDMKTVVGYDKELKIYISPGGEEHIAWDDWAQKDIKTKTKKPDDWQYKVMRDAIERVGEEFGISLREVNKEKKSDTQIKVTTVPNADAVNGSWKRDGDGATDIYLSMTYQSGLDGVEKKVKKCRTSSRWVQRRGRQTLGRYKSKFRKKR